MLFRYIESFIYLFIILFIKFASITWKCEEPWCNSVIMKEISLDALWNLNDPQILFQNLLSKNYWWKNTLSLSKVLIYYEIGPFTKEVPLTFEDDIIFRFLYITLKSSMMGQHRWKNLITIISSWKHVHFSKILFLGNCCIIQESLRGSHKKISQNS